MYLRFADRRQDLSANTPSSIDNVGIDVTTVPVVVISVTTTEAETRRMTTTRYFSWSKNSYRSVSMMVNIFSSIDDPANDVTRFPVVPISVQSVVTN